MPDTTQMDYAALMQATKAIDTTVTPPAEIGVTEEALYQFVQTMKAAVDLGPLHDSVGAALITGLIVGHRFRRLQEG